MRDFDRTRSQRETEDSLLYAEIVSQQIIKLEIEHDPRNAELKDVITDIIHCCIRRQQREV
jgi:hypothetical protein